MIIRELIDKLREFPENTQIRFHDTSIYESYGMLRPSLEKVESEDDVKRHTMAAAGKVSIGDALLVFYYST